MSDMSNEVTVPLCPEDTKDESEEKETTESTPERMQVLFHLLFLSWIETM